MGIVIATTTWLNTAARRGCTTWSIIAIVAEPAIKNRTTSDAVPWSRVTVDSSSISIWRRPRWRCWWRRSDLSRSSRWIYCQIVVWQSKNPAHIHMQNDLDTRWIFYLIEWSGREHIDLSSQFNSGYISWDKGLFKCWISLCYERHIFITFSFFKHASWFRLVFLQFTRLLQWYSIIYTIRSILSWASFTFFNWYTDMLEIVSRWF